MVVWPLRGHRLARFVCVVVALVAVGVGWSASWLSVRQTGVAALAMAIVCALAAAASLLVFTVACVLGWRAHSRPALAESGWAWFTTSCSIAVLTLLLLVDAFFTALSGVRSI
jgi:hypothetical protein